MSTQKGLRSAKEKGRSIGRAPLAINGATVNSSGNPRCALPVWEPGPSESSDATPFRRAPACYGVSVTAMFSPCFPIS